MVGIAFLPKVQFAGPDIIHDLGLPLSDKCTAPDLRLQKSFVREGGIGPRHRAGGNAQLIGQIAHRRQLCTNTQCIVFHRRADCIGHPLILRSRLITKARRPNCTHYNASLDS